MTDKPSLPSAALESARGDEPPVNLCKSDGDTGTFIAEQPELLGLNCQVQHPNRAGQPFTTEPGMLGFGVLTTSADHYMFMVNVMHADGTSLSAMLTMAEWLSLGDIYFEVCESVPMLAPKGEA